jgi:hypothetical protein
MFSAFVLRALGYSEDSGDFTYAQAQEFAAEIGLFGADSENDAFLRDDIAGMSYAALFQQMNDDSSEILLEKLVSQNAVDAAAAQKYLDYYNTYQDYLAASSAYEQSAGIKIGIDSAIIMTVDGVTQEITQTTESSIVLKAGDLVMKQVGTTDLAGSTTEFTSYFADGWLYMDTAVGKFKYQYPIDLSTAIEQAGISKAEPFYLIDSIKKTETADGASYTMTYSVTAVNSLIGSSLSQLSVSSETVGIQCRSLSTVFHFDTEVYPQEYRYFRRPQYADSLRRADNIHGYVRTVNLHDPGIRKHRNRYPSKRSGYIHGAGPHIKRTTDCPPQS